MTISFPGVPDVTRQFAADPFSSLQLGMDRSRQNRLNRTLDPLAIEKAQRENRLAREKEISDKQRATQAAQQQQMQQGFLVANVLKSIPIDQRPTVAATLAKKYPALDIDPNDDYSDEMLDLALNVESAINANDPERAKIAIEALNARTKATEAKKGSFTDIKDAPGAILNKNTGEVTVDPALQEIAGQANAAQAWTPKINFDVSKELNNKFISPAVDVYSAAKDLEELSKDASATDSVAVIFRLMKSLDPTSTVREGEYATVQNSGGLPAFILNNYNAVLGGGRLTDKQLNEIQRTAKKLANSKIKESKGAAEGFLDSLDNLPNKNRRQYLDQFPPSFDIGEAPAEKAPQKLISNAPKRLGDEPGQRGGRAPAIGDEIIPGVRRVR